MSKQHEENIMVKKPDSGIGSVINTLKCHVRDWLIKRLFGDTREVREEIRTDSKHFREG